MPDCHASKRPFDALTRHGGGLAIANDRLWPDASLVSVESGIPFPPPSHRIVGCTPQFFPMFSFHGVSLADGNAPRKRLEALCWLLVGWLLPLPRVGSFRGL